MMQSIHAFCGTAFRRVAGVVLIAVASGVAAAADSSVVARATWNGGADSALDNPSSWLCFDESGNQIPGALPTSATVVDIPEGRIFNCPNGAPFVCKKLNLPASLAGNCDLRGVSAELGGTVDLKGRKIYLSTANGEVTFTDGGEYVLLESLRAPRGAYIDTEFVPTSETRTVMDLIVGGDYENWFGVSGGGTGSWWKQSAYAVGNNPNNLYIGFGNNSADAGATAHRPKDWRGTVELNKNVYSAYEPGSTDPCATYSVTYTSFTSKLTMFLFAHHTDDPANYTKQDNNITCFGCKIWDNGTLVRNYVPAQRISDGVVGLVDLANGNAFKPSASATAFVAGRPLDVEEGGEVHFDIPDGRTATNSGILFKGTVKVVKEGPGTFVANKAGQSYVGGTLVAAGTAKSALDINNAPWGAAGISIVVSSGATLDVNGRRRYDLCPIILDGGTLANSVAHANDQAAVAIGDITLTKDSTFAGTANTVFGGVGGHVTIDLDGHTFNMGGVLWLEGCTFTGGGTVVTSGSHFYPIKTADDFRGVACRIGSTEFVKQADVDFGDLEILSTSTSLSFYNAIRIHGVFTVAATQRLNNFQMQDGSTINLKNRNLPWRTFGEGSGYTTEWLTYAEGATVKVDLTGKSLVDNTVVLEWSGVGVPPVGVTFVPWANGARIEGADLDVTSTGCILRRQVVTATWSNAEGDGNVGDPGNWTCYDADGNVVADALPTSTTVVSIPEGLIFNCTNGAPFRCKKLNLPASLAGDCDVRGVSAELGGTVDLKGHKIYLSTAKGEVTFTDGGEYVLLESLLAPRGAYIDTEFVPTSETRTVMDLIVGGDYENWFGVSGGGTGSWWKQFAYAVGNNPNNLYIGFGNNSADAGATAHRPKDWRGTVELNKNVYSAYEPGSTEPCATYSVTYTSFTSKLTMFLFAHHTDDPANYTKQDNNITCFGCKIWDNGTLVRNYVPAQRISDGVVGLIDLANGNAFKASASTTAFVAGRPLDVEDGEVHFDIPEGKTETNSGIVFNGTVKVVKEGTGTLVATKTGQAYRGGTDIAAGTFRCGTYGHNHIYGADGSTVTVHDGATFDCDGWSNHHLFRFVLDGGTLKNETNRNGAGNPWFADVTLTKDSFMAGCGFGFVAPSLAATRLQMNEHKLTVDVNAGGGDRYLFLVNLTVEGGGEIYVRSGGYLALGGNPTSNQPVMAETTTLHIGQGAIHDGGGEHVFGSYVSESTGDWDDAKTVIKVLKRFAPLGTKWHATELQNGATLDLSACTGVWNVTCEFEGSKNSATATFAAGATIDVELGDRTISAGDKVIGWTPETAPAKGVKFLSKLGKLRKMSDGAYYMQAFMIMIR